TEARLRRNRDTAMPSSRSPLPSMKSVLRSLVVPALLLAFTPPAPGAATRLSNGRNFAGWEGKTNKTWRIVDGAFVGGTLEAKIPRNEFLRTQRRFTNFVLRVRFKLVGTAAGGFINGGVQIRSEPAKNPPAAVPT